MYVCVTWSGQGSIRLPNKEGLDFEVIISPKFFFIHLVFSLDRLLTYLSDNEYARRN